MWLPGCNPFFQDLDIIARVLYCVTPHWYNDFIALAFFGFLMQGRSSSSCFLSFSWKVSHVYVLLFSRYANPPALLHIHVPNPV